MKRKLLKTIGLSNMTKDIIYLSNALPESLYKKYNLKLSMASQRFNGLLIGGLKGKGAVTVYSTSVGDLPTARVIEEYDGIRYIIIRKGIFNRFWQNIRMLAHITVRSREVVIVSDYLNNVLFNTLFVLINIIYKIPAAVIVTDLPSFFKIRSIFDVKIVAWRALSWLVLKGYKKHIFLTKQMNDVVHSKSWIVMEGVVPFGGDKQVSDNHTKKKVILYAGGIEKEYGVGLLVKSFIKAIHGDYELHVYGDGSYLGDCKSMALDNKEVKFFGVVPNSTVVKAEQSAMILVNPRCGSLDFTKYSFPSKNLEYMCSGTATLCYLLPGMPEEYRDYIIELKSEDEAGMISEITKALLMSPEKLTEIGHKAKKFVSEYKNSGIQADRIVHFVCPDEASLSVSNLPGRGFQW